MLAACGSPAGLTNRPNLAAQFGTSDDDIGVDVVVGKNGQVYSLARESGPSGTYPGFFNQGTIRRYDSAGSLLGETVGEFYSCSDEYSCGPLDVISLGTNAQGNVYALYAQERLSGDCMVIRDTFAKRYDAAGNQTRVYGLGTTGEGFGTGTPLSRNAALAVDGSGSIYAGFEQADVDPYGTCEATDITRSLVKRSPTGVLQWQRPSDVSEITDMVVTSAGSLYVAGMKGLARYDTSGNLVWIKSVGPLENVVVSGTNIYTRYRLDVRKFDANGKQLWLKRQGGLSGIVVQDMAGDTSGNLYLSGKYNASASNRSAFARKLNSSGSVLWTKPYGTSSYDDARGIATLGGTDVYVTGETQGSLAHSNYGGPQNRDGYLRRLNSSGNPIWTR